ncbi:DUF7675 family protein [Aerococcus vaginalis]
MMIENPHVSEDDIYYIGPDGVFAECHLDGYADFYKENIDDEIWTIHEIPSTRGPFLFSFDRKTIYNFWSDYDKLTEQQKAIFREEYDTMAALKEGI